ncbi:hypothetical protein [Amycolatopsis sp. NBC_00438]|uniref:hypothetical protein n=1 Tax=Amycolatopsis sp. NBC_00438 TaxID=2903558 RepID=UPI002E214209
MNSRFAGLGWDAVRGDAGGKGGAQVGVGIQSGASGGENSASGRMWSPPAA